MHNFPRGHVPEIEGSATLSKLSVSLNPNAESYLLRNSDCGRGYMYGAAPHPNLLGAFGIHLATPPVANSEVMNRILRNNGLSIVLAVLFLVFWWAQSVTGLNHYNQEQLDHGQPTVTYGEYLTGNHFLEATMENWESEFLQMFAFVVLTVFLYQKGSAESKDPNADEEVDRDPRRSKKKNTPLPVRKGGWLLKLYKHSLSLTFLLLFLTSLVLHAVGGAGDYNEEQREHGRTEMLSTLEYMGTSRFWFESFQNWQSEFLAVGSMVVFTIFLRERGSKESKPVATPHAEMGE